MHLFKEFAMEKKSLFLMLLLLGLSTHMTMRPMFIYGTFSNAGMMFGYNFYVIAFSCENNGTIKAFNTANVKVTTLTGYGSINAYNGSISCSNYNFNGSVYCKQECLINATKIEANGTIEAKKVIIICDTFNFSGTICCSEECIIYVKNPFDYTQLKRNGEGKFTVIITENKIDLFSPESLVSDTVKKLENYKENLTEAEIENELKKARTRAVLNRVDDIKILEDIKENIEQKVQYFKERIHQKRGPSSYLGASALCGTGSMLGVSMATAVLLYPDLQAQRYKLSNSVCVKAAAVIAAAISIGSSLASYVFFAEWLDPKYKEKYEKLSLVIPKIDEALLVQRVPEEEIIILQ